MIINVERRCNFLGKYFNNNRESRDICNHNKKDFKTLAETSIFTAQLHNSRGLPRVSKCWGRRDTRPSKTFFSLGKTLVFEPANCSNCTHLHTLLDFYCSYKDFFLWLGLTVYPLKVGDWEYFFVHQHQSETSGMWIHVRNWRYFWIPV